MWKHQGGLSRGLGPAREHRPSCVECLCLCREAMGRSHPCPSSVPPVRSSLQTTDGQVSSCEKRSLVSVQCFRVSRIQSSGLGSPYPWPTSSTGAPPPSGQTSPLHILFPLLGMPFLPPSELLHNPQDPVQMPLSELLCGQRRSVSCSLCGPSVSTSALRRSF